jgi:hypothetical protein
MSRRYIQLIVLVLLLTSCGDAPPPIEANAPAEPLDSFTEDDLLGIWVSTQEDVVLRFTEDGRYCLAKFRDELDTFPGDCGSFEVVDMVLTFTSDQGYCKGEIGIFSLAVNPIGQLQMKATSDDCYERRVNIDNKTLGPGS